MPRHLFTTGRTDFLPTSDGRRVFVIDTDDFMATGGDAWRNKSGEEVLADMRALYEHINSNFEKLFPTSINELPKLRPVPHTPQSVAQQRARAIFGPKRGRWR